MTPYELTCTMNAIQILRPQAQHLRRAIGHHYAHRHDGRGSKVVRMWIQAFREFDKGSGYTALQVAVNA